MLWIVLIGIVITLTAFAILAKVCAAKPKKAERSEKGEIIKQLLALSERENSRPGIAAPPTRNPDPDSISATSGKSTSRERNSKRRYSPGPQPPILSGANQPGRNQPGHSKADSQTDDKIRQRAYEERGGLNGSSTKDWLQAKQEVLSRKARAANRSS